jgi:hypothetical protein
MAANFKNIGTFLFISAETTVVLTVRLMLYIGAVR